MGVPAGLQESPRRLSPTRACACRNQEPAADGCGHGGAVVPPATGATVSRMPITATSNATTETTRTTRCSRVAEMACRKSAVARTTVVVAWLSRSKRTDCESIRSLSSLPRSWGSPTAAVPDRSSRSSTYNITAGVNLGIGIAYVVSLRRLERSVQQAVAEIRKPRVTGPPRRLDQLQQALDKTLD